MQSMKKVIGLALLASMGVAGTASAEGSFSGNVAIGTDYVFRGISQTEEGPAVSGGFDYSNGIFYAGTWASNVDFGADIDDGFEIDFYAGVKPTTGPVTWDLAILGYFYPGSEDPPGVDLDYYELKVAPSISPVDGLTLGGALFYSPEFSGSTDSAIYYEVNAAFALNDMVTFSGAVGMQQSDQTGFFVLDDATSTDEYTQYNVGATIAIAGFGVDVRYHDTDENITNLNGNTVSDERFVLTLKRAL